MSKRNLDDSKCIDSLNLIQMTNFRLLSSAVALLSFMTVSAQKVVPGRLPCPCLLRIEGNAGKVIGTVTAPKNNDQWTALPSDTRIDLAWSVPVMPWARRKCRYSV